eukprot:gb/GECG01016609.1/.p1 GENE.gb/GECG01016609.1/~~gb/GECG01016609.1/.p1  ORF type:complete len:551 (+),score=95.71 gb/GECG01016609.1/:1-1653(+)
MSTSRLTIHPSVQELVRLIGRAFYRDEFVVILDALTSEIFLRDDRLGDYFRPLSGNLVRRILIELQKDHLVSSEEVVEQAIRKKDREPDENAHIESMEQYLRRLQQQDNENENAEKDNEGDGEGTAEDGGKKRALRDKTEKTVCWYINPRLAVDAIRYRLFRMSNHLHERETGNSQLKEYVCPQCGYAATSTEFANMYLQRAAASDIHQLSTGMHSRKGGNSAGNEVACPTPTCNSVLRRKDMSRIREHSSSASDRFKSLISTHSRIQELLNELGKVRLGPNRPSDHIHQGKVSIKDPNRRNPTTANTSRSSSSRAEKVQPFSPGVYALNDTEVEVHVPEDEGFHENGEATDNHRRQKDGSNTVSIEAVPEIIAKSAYTGKRVQSIGFHHVDTGNADRATDNDTGTEDEEDDIMNFLAAEAQGEGETEQDQQQPPKPAKESSSREHPVATHHHQETRKRPAAEVDASGTEADEEGWESGSETSSEWESSDSDDDEMAREAAASIKVRVAGEEKTLLETSDQDINKMSNDEHEEYLTAMRKWNEVRTSSST